MKQLITFVKKEFYHVFRDKKTLLLLFGMPIVLIILFGFALTNEIKNSSVLICDYAKDAASQQIIEKIKASKNFDVEKAVITKQQVEDAFKEGRAKLAIIFPSNFYSDLLHFNKAQIQIIADASDPNTANTLTSYASNIILEYQQELLKATKPKIKIATEVRMIYNPELKGATNFVPGVMSLILVLVCVLMTSVSIVKEKELGSIEVLLVSPFNPILVIISKAIPYFILSLLNLTIIIILSITIMDMPMNGSYFVLYISSALSIITSLSLGLLISSSTNSQQEAIIISLMGMLTPTTILTGFLFPIENMPIPLQLISNLFPSKWYYIIVKSIMIKGLGITSILKELSILTAMTIILLSLSLKKFKIRLA